MKYSRERDEICIRLSKMQARMFEKASEEGLPSYFFVKAYATSPYILKIDSLKILDIDLSEQEIFEAAKRKVKTRRGTVYEIEVMGWIGYLLREWSYRYDVFTPALIKKVSLSYLASVYHPYHSLDVLKAIQKIAEEKNIDLNEDPQQRLIRILKEMKKEN